MATSKTHEWIKKTWARLLEAWADERRVRLVGFGSWTVKRRQAEVGFEADECYELGYDDKERPDLALEVVLTSGGIDELEVYRRLRVPEVWFWRRGKIEVHVLRGTRYVVAPRSELLPDLDLAQMAAFLERRDQADAVWDYRRALRGET